MISFSSSLNSSTNFKFKSVRLVKTYTLRRGYADFGQNSGNLDYIILLPHSLSLLSFLSSTYYCFLSGLSDTGINLKCRTNGWNYKWARLFLSMISSPWTVKKEITNRMSLTCPNWMRLFFMNYRVPTP